MIIVSQGSRGPEVLFVQRLLNKKGARAQLAEDSIFGPRTRAAVAAFQQGQRVPDPPGLVNSATYRALGLNVERVHNVTLMGQPDDSTCWSAASTMMGGNRQSVGQGAASTDTDGSLSFNVENFDTFAAGLGWRPLLNMSSPPVSVLIPPLSRGPVWIAFEGGTFRHAVVFSAIYSDSTDEGTVFRVHDPWPPGRGTVYGSTYLRHVINLASIAPPRAAMIQYAAAPP